MNQEKSLNILDRTTIDVLDRLVCHKKTALITAAALTGLTTIIGTTIEVSAGAPTATPIRFAVRPTPTPTPDSSFISAIDPSKLEPAVAQTIKDAASKIIPVADNDPLIEAGKFAIIGAVLGFISVPATLRALGKQIKEAEEPASVSLEIVKKQTVTGAILGLELLAIQKLLEFKTINKSISALAPQIINAAQDKQFDSLLSFSFFVPIATLIGSVVLMADTVRRGKKISPI